MKKVIIVLCLLAIAGGLMQMERAAKKRYLKNETMLRYLKKRPHFARKLAAPPPVWMEEQLNEDFSPFAEKGIAKEAIDATFARISEASQNSMVVRYRIINNELYRYFNDDEVISFEDTSTEKAIKTLLQKTHFPDMDFILSYYDGMGPGSSFFHTPDRQLQAPVLCSAKIKGTPFVVLIPDWRSIGHWWVSNIRAIKKNRAPWEKKRNGAIWRGGLTKPVRLKLCQLSLQHPEALDAKLCDYGMRKDDDPRVMGQWVSWDEMLSYKYLPYADGVMCAAPALQWRLLSQSVTFKPDSDEIQWFYRALKPYVHYIPVQSAFEDLIDKLEWAKVHDTVCKEIADNAFHFAANNLMYDDVLLYLSLVLKRYASLQTFNGSTLEQDPRHWVKIQFRDEIRKQAASDGTRRYQQTATPF